ncbi:NAD(P)/FAD-dependent oxidoreductase [Amycolatopsis nigrescens]|uniref:NAD(P)/FAD-dependent oxidoreductase n=1 Tax=Amycolatopsis nigrescens TaxID=381445 RepID=UPI000372A363|nr:FAD-dependent oxidoreductase [Amycolatopsis nigrescens]
MRAAVIVGAGHAGFQAAASLRDKGYPHRVVLVGDEPGVPYQRPPLSKAYLTGTLPGDKLALRPRLFYDKHDIELVAGRAVAIDREHHRLRLAGGRSLPYGHLVLATGARNRRLPGPGGNLDGVLGLRTMADADRLRERLGTARDVVVIGGGFIGLEFAASAARLGVSVTVVELADRLMRRAVSPTVSQHYRVLHERQGNRVLSGVAVAGLHGTGHVTAVELADGTVLPADLVVVGIGVVPNTELAAEAGLAVDNGIVVDEHMSTSDPDISAIGDCAAYPSRHAGGQVRSESVQNAVDHARCLAARLTGAAEPYASVPWFWSNQFDARLQIAGIAAGHDEAVVHGRPDDGGFSVFCFRERRLVAVESVNRVPDHMAARRLFTAGGSLRPSDVGEDFDLRQHVARIA